MLTGHKIKTDPDFGLEEMLALPDCKYPLKLITQENLQLTGVSEGAAHTYELTLYRYPGSWTWFDKE